MKISILHTNDIHSRFENLAKIVTLIKKSKDSSTLILDAGDFNDFMRLELQGTYGHAGVELLEAAGYDAIAVGNNETFQGIDMLEAMAAESKVPFLSCNLRRKDMSFVKGVKGSALIDKGGVRFLIIGVSPSLGDFYPLLGFAETDAAEAIKNEISDNRGLYDICLLLSHKGYNNDREFAQSIDGLDIIIGGHSHTLMEEAEIENGTIIHQAGGYGEHLGVVELEYDGKVKACEGKCIKSGDFSYDSEIIKVIERNKDAAIDNLSVPLYNIHRDMWHDVIEENPITNLLADGLRDFLQCEIGLINSGVINGGIRRGPVTKKKLIDICPSPLNVTYLELQGKDIREALGQSLYSDFCQQDGRGPGFRGKSLGRLHVSGAVIFHDGKHIEEISVGGQPLDDEKWYKVATSDYIQRGTGYQSLANNRNPKYYAEMMGDILKEYLAREDYLDMSYRDRWIKR